MPSWCDSQARKAPLHHIGESPSAAWGSGVYSIAKFELSPAGGATMLVFDQAGFPETQGEHLEQGWHKMHWEPLRKYLEQPA